MLPPGQPLKTASVELRSRFKTLGGLCEGLPVGGGLIGLSETVGTDGTGRQLVKPLVVRPRVLVAQQETPVVTEPAMGPFHDDPRPPQAATMRAAPLCQQRA